MKPIKDGDAAHPVATAWRATFHEIVKAFSHGDYRLAAGIARVDPVTASLAKQIREAVRDYGETLSDLPAETWKTSIAQWMETHWEVLVDLWTNESGSSDLVLHARVREVEDDYRIKVDSVHVP